MLAAQAGGLLDIAEVSRSIEVSQIERSPLSDFARKSFFNRKSRLKFLLSPTLLAGDAVIQGLTTARLPKRRIRAARLDARQF